MYYTEASLLIQPRSKQCEIKQMSTCSICTKESTKTKSSGYFLSGRQIFPNMLLTNKRSLLPSCYSFCSFMSHATFSQRCIHRLSIVTFPCTRLSASAVTIALGGVHGAACALIAGRVDRAGRHPESLCHLLKCTRNSKSAEKNGPMSTQFLQPA